MSDTERHALTLRLLGTGKKGEPPGPLDSGWVVQHLAGTRTTLQRWRSRGIPQDRLDDVLEAVRNALDITKEAAPSEEGAAEELLRRWLGDQSPPWATALTESILNAVRVDRLAFLDQAAEQYAALAELLRDADSDDAEPPGRRGPRPRRPGPRPKPSP